ncbi:MAG TPA: NUDIX domain-containing protein [Candidatus Saccharimonadales bacterium]|nr:NUDIX domain-containing protein [Candidatus Saccharimonadales bacterium]
MPHIHTEPGQHDHTASVYLFRTDFDEPKVVLHRHKKFNKYLQFGGHVELHETPWQAIIHELREESGYDINQIRILQPETRMTKISNSILHPQPVVHSTHPIGPPVADFEHFHTDIAYAATTDRDPIHQPEEGESTSIQLFTRDELIALPDEQIIKNAREIMLHIFDHILPTWQPVEADTFES